MLHNSGDPINVFLDTEFTNLHPVEKKLISVGACTEFSTADGLVPTTFYAELTDTYKRKDCSTFVKQNVLPLLTSEKKHQADYFTMILNLCKWIEDMPREVVLVSDAPAWDFTFFTDMLNDSSIRPPNLVGLASFSAGPIMPPESMYSREHHAGDDAWINLLWAKQNLKAVGDDGIKIVHSFTIQPS